MDFICIDYLEKKFLFYIFFLVLFVKVVVCQIGDFDFELKELFRFDLENVILLMIFYDDQILVVFDSEEKLIIYDIVIVKVLYIKEIKKDESQF